MKRIRSIDIVRGLVMMIMALDHVRDLMHVTSITQQPTDLATTSPLLFFTRWITHFCAPTFVFLSGTSAFISFINKKNIEVSRNFLFTRGIWLTVLDFTLVNFGLWFDIHFNVFLFDVLSAIGFGFIILALMLKVQAKAIAITGLVIIVGHALVPLIPFTESSLANKIILPFFIPGAMPFGAGKTFVMGYPPIPWLGIMLLGFACGKIFLIESAKRKSLFFKIGLSAWVIFGVVRFVNIYGNLAPWSSQKSALYTFLSFINITKYPPSLDFCLVTLGGMFLMLAWVENWQNKFSVITTVYGKVPLFFFLVHWFIIHPLMFLMVYWQGYTTNDLVFGFNFGRPKEGSGIELSGIYLVWICVLLILYPICRWYGNYKINHRNIKWLRYL